MMWSKKIKQLKKTVEGERSGWFLYKVDIEGRDQRKIKKKSSRAR